MQLFIGHLKDDWYIVVEINTTQTSHRWKLRSKEIKNYWTVKKITDVQFIHECQGNSLTKRPWHQAMVWSNLNHRRTMVNEQRTARLCKGTTENAHITTIHKNRVGATNWSYKMMSDTASYNLKVLQLLHCIV